VEVKKKRNQYAFDKTKYDHVHLQLQKGRKAEVQERAESAGQSLNGYITQAVDERMEREKEDTK
jgi:predicted HicB family RNase H-like nuclease